MPRCCMEWRQPHDVFGQRLSAAFDAVLAAPHDPGCLAEFEYVLAELYQRYQQDRIDRLGWMGDELDERLAAGQYRVAPDVANFVERLRELIGSPSPYTTCSARTGLHW